MSFTTLPGNWVWANGLTSYENTHHTTSYNANAVSWMDASWSDNGSVGAAAGSTHGDRSEAIQSLLGIGQMQVYDAEVYQQNGFLSLRNSGSVWEILDQNHTVVKSHSWLDWCGGVQVCLAMPGSAGNKSART